VCDLEMPEMSGVEVLEALRDTSPELAARLVFHSAAGPPSMQSTMHIAKGVSRHIMLAVLDIVCATAR